MHLNIDTDAKKIDLTENGSTRSIDLYSKESFEVLSDLWSKVAWNEKYTYTFTWMGVPTVQLPEDVMRLQEVIWRVKPDVIIECGVAHGGGVVMYAGWLKAMGQGRVIGVEVEFRGNHKEQIENHLMGDRIELVVGSSIDPQIVQRVKDMIKPGEKVMVILDSNHSKAHVAAELEAYHDMVSVGSYIVATDGCMEFLYDVPRGKPEWKDDNPASAAREFAAAHSNFVIDNPKPEFNESELDRTLTHWPDAWLKRVS
jgi:cephalosporin hydroxylase